MSIDPCSVVRQTVLRFEVDYFLLRIPLYIYPFMKHGDESYKQHYDTVPTNMLYEGYLAV